MRRRITILVGKMFPDRRFLGSLSATPDDESMTTTSNSGLSVFIIWYEAQALSTTETDFRIRPELPDLITHPVITRRYGDRLKAHGRHGEFRFGR